MGPPPLPGMAATKIIKKKPRKVPQAKMKGLQWNKLPPTKVKGTVFEKMATDYEGIPIDYAELEDQFSAKVIEKKVDEEEKKKNQVVSILDPKTSQALSIFLSQFKNASNEELCKNLYELNSKFYALDQIKQITQFLPSKDDVRQSKISF
jgi:hypothetical protein